MTIPGATATELLDALCRGDVTAVAVAEAHLERIGAGDGVVHAFLHVDRDSAIRQAEAVDWKRRAGHPVGRLAGLPVAIKDNLCTQGVPTTCSSRMLENFVSPYDATVIER